VSRRAAQQQRANDRRLVGGELAGGHLLSGQLGDRAVAGVVKLTGEQVFQIVAPA
jgi:hypothetical protein